MLLDRYSENIVVRLVESVFIDTSNYVLKKDRSAKSSGFFVRVHVESCKFTRSQAIHLQCNSVMTVSITRSVFSTDGSSVKVFG